ncbi:hypothetical protein [Agarilytica rhodophyticola]|uniref:hypothetical protein n=1 Tax=Agarilytica rhodophyticola TaxID=1737490 RepID=UPI000B34643C|nr:hypothetical protein [Agarilytica rhodophyticola]
MKKNTTLDIWTNTCDTLFASKEENKSQLSIHPLHTCVIEQERHYIHAPDLEQKDPVYFARLQRFASKHRIKLKADRRIENQNKTHGRRKKLLPMIFLALSVNTDLAMAQQQEEQKQQEQKEPQETTTLNLFSINNPYELEEQTISNQRLQGDERVELYADKTTIDDINNILLTHLVPQEDDPKSMVGDIQELAAYYARHPEAVSLIKSIENEDWQLRYAPYTFQTDVNGSQLKIEDVVVYFDPRSAAKLKFYDKCSHKKPFCVASPADALLHELLHVQTIVKDTHAFIAQGGMGKYLYPAEHERLTILKENILYKSMSIRDKHPRPIRSEHTGRHVLVSCVTCIE